MSRKPARRRIPVRYSRLFGALEKLIAGFDPASGIEPFRVPSDPKPFDDLVAAFFGEDDPVEIWNDTPDHLVDLVVYTAVDGGPGSSNGKSISALTLPSKRRVYIESCEFSGLHVLASAPPAFTKDDVAKFLRFLFADNGARFGTFVFGPSIPTEFAIGVDLPRQDLIELTFDLAAKTGMLESVRSEGDWQVALPAKPRPRIPAWERKLRKEFGPITGFAAGMGFNALRRRYMEKHGLTAPEPGPWPEEKEYSDREVVELWLQSQNIIDNPHRRAAKRRSR